ncbi:metallophosphoesterase [Sphingomonas sp. PvP056]|uniref:metallophosphoesterase family protein n=1 Tax=Sphingomonas sp. PvP056 TaxID=3156392 RepID=UPI003391AFE3
MVRVLHSADWQLGKAFGCLELDVRVALIEARFDAIDAIGQAARVHDAGHVLVAGNVFDTECPEDRTIVQALSRMERDSCRWWLLSGNHDYARNGGLWDRVRARRTGNVIILTEPDPQEMEDGV